ncbi:hypothetical protein V6Z12_A05G415200 [Gossypium hirsutum]|uniref:Uncharacterized protein n=1 Tax=Gossypium tomentosum TaxID=34277 RepID=A0A5D2QUG7_GOSTO|nr:hypothetical protein ES332_A05G420800v1 [Gossypium tomentosum]
MENKMKSKKISQSHQPAWPFIILLVLSFPNSHALMDSHSKRYPNLVILNCSLLCVISSSIRRFSPSPLWFCYTVDHRFPSQGFCYERGGNILMYNYL